MNEMEDHTKDKIYKLNKAARKNFHTDGTTFLSHTDRWIKNEQYREQKRRDGCPKWLVYPSGDTARCDGQRGDEFEVRGQWQ